MRSSASAFRQKSGGRFWSLCSPRWRWRWGGETSCARQHRQTASMFEGATRRGGDAGNGPRRYVWTEAGPHTRADQPRPETDRGEARRYVAGVPNVGRSTLYRALELNGRKGGG